MNSPVESNLRSSSAFAAQHDGRFVPRCERCDYPLVGLKGPRCPECGRAFDPCNRRTFALISRRKRTIRKAVKWARRNLLSGAIFALRIFADAAALIAVCFSLHNFFQYEVGLWLMRVVIGAALTWPVIVIGRDRARWRWWELDAFVLPFCALSHCIAMSLRLDDLRDIVAALAISLAIPIAALVRIKIGHRMNRILVSMALLIALCCVAVGVYTVLPMGTWN